MSAVTRLGAAWAVLQRHPRHVVLAGVVIGLALAPVGSWPAVVLATVLAASAVLWRTEPWALLAVAVAAALLAGASVGELRLAALDRTTLAPLAGREVEARLTLLDVPRTRAGGLIAVPARVSDAGVRGAGGGAATGAGAGERILLEVARGGRELPGIGAEVAVSGRLRELGPFDAYERRRGAHARLTAQELHATGARRGGVAGVLDGVRRRAAAGLGSGLVPARAALAEGMVLGQDDALSDDLREDLRASGLSHLVAASGANVALLATLVLVAATLAGAGLTLRLALALIAVVAYVPLAGGGPSVQRAGVMGGAALVAMLAGRPGSRWYALGLAAAVTLALNPRATSDVGWQLSFAAVVALLAGGRPLAAAFGRVAPRPIAEALAVTGAATLATAPLVALHFGRLSVVSVGANLLAAPVVAPVMWLGTIASALGQIDPSLARLPSALSGPPLAWLTWVASTAAGMPGAQAGAPGVVALLTGWVLAVAGCVLAVRRWGAREGRSRRPWLLPAVLAGVAIVLAGGARITEPRPPDGLVVSFLDVGQGDATLVQHGEHAILVDAGPPDGHVVRRLHDAGVRRLDALVLTHTAEDHDGGGEAVLAALPVGLVLDGGEINQPGSTHRAALALAGAEGVPRVHSDVGQTVRAGPITARVLWPPRARTAPVGAEPNDRATVLHVSDGAFDLLLSADAESNVLSRLVLPAVEAMKVPHHGSEDPGLPVVLRRLHPSVAVVPVGAHNTYGHPVASTMAALRAAVPVVRRTDRDGTVRVLVNGTRMRVQTAR